MPEEFYIVEPGAEREEWVPVDSERGRQIAAASEFPIVPVVRDVLFDVRQARQAALDLRRQADQATALFVEQCRRAREAGAKMVDIADAAGMTRWALHQTIKVHTKPVPIDV